MEKLRSAEKARISTCRFADLLAKKSIRKFREIFPEIQGQTVIAAVAVINEAGDLEIVSLAAGTRFANGKLGSGFISDCHAEVLARRAFNRFLVDRPGNFFKSVHLYVSSQPCGNACVRRWAKSRREVFDDSIDEKTLPVDVHEKISAHAIAEGQFAAEFKAPGIFSCSDKIAIWNSCGIVKRCISHFFPRIDFSSITVGRKFVRPHAQRAFCCRLQSAGLKKLNHPVIMCTSVKLDEGGMDAERGASFADSKCMWWSIGRNVEFIDPSTGLQISGEPSAACSSRLAADAAQLPGNLNFAAYEKLRARLFLET